MHLAELPESPSAMSPGAVGIKPESVTIGELTLAFHLKYTWFDVEITRDGDTAVIAPANPPGRIGIELAEA